MVQALSKKEASRHALANSGQLMVSLVRVMDTSGDVETVRAIAGTLHSISGTRYEYHHSNHMKMGLKHLMVLRLCANAFFLAFVHRFF